MTAIDGNLFVKNPKVELHDSTYGKRSEELSQYGPTYDDNVGREGRSRSLESCAKSFGSVDQVG
ncbi:hypothetical protein GCM10009628_42430 [Paeniglutamicibacter kerguelensis]